MTITEISEVTQVIENIQKLVEQNQKDYTNAKFQELQSLFEQLKIVVASELEHTTDLHNEKSRFSSQEFKQLAEKVVIFSDSYNQRLKLLERDTVTSDKVEMIMAKRTEKRWTERAIYIVFALGVIVTSYGAFSSLNSDFTTHVQVSEQHEHEDDRRFMKIETDISDHEAEMDVVVDTLRSKEASLEIDVTKLKGFHGL